MSYKNWIVGLGVLFLTLSPMVEKAVGAEEYPAQMVKIICGYLPGGSTERPIRLLLPFLQKHLKQSVMIENLTGAQGILATNKVFTSPSDGYTLLIGQPGTLILQEKYLPETSHYKTQDLTHIFNIASDDFVLLSHPEVWKNFGEFLKGAQSKRLRVGMSGKGTHTHLYIVMLQEMTKVGFNIIPFEGGAQSMTALAGKHLDATGTFISASHHLIRSGSLHPLVVFSDRRHPVLPQTPIPKEIGFTSFEPFDFNTGIFGPPKMAAERVKILEEAFAKAVKEPEFLEKAKEANVGVYPLSSREYFVRTEKAYSIAEKYIKILKGIAN